MKYDVIIGLEVHVQLKTKSKMFCRCSASVWKAQPNSHTCPVCLGLPGALPVANEEAVREALKIGLALNCQLLNRAKFDRKHYFYPDLSKGYQISQYDLPFCVNGWLEVDGSRIGVTRSHLEEDTGKLVHDDKNSLIDFNRSGIPLMEVVSEPDIRSPQEARLYAQKIQQIVRYLGVSDADMERGSLRVDANVSLQKPGKWKVEDGKVLGVVNNELNPKVEIKNMNSFRSIERALTYEIERQLQLFEKEEKLSQETRGWVEAKGITVKQRSKEFAPDYRYFPEPDLPPFVFKNSYFEVIKKEIPELPDQKINRFYHDYALEIKEAEIVTATKELADWFEGAVKAYAQTEKEGTTYDHIDSWKVKLIYNWVSGELLRRINELQVPLGEVKVTPAQLAELLYLIDKGEISSTIAKEVFAEMFKTGLDAKKIVEEKGLKQVSDEIQLREAVREVINLNPKPVADIAVGKKEAKGFLIGQIMKMTSGRANPGLVNKILEEELG
ncbi:MAG: Asp-tRNA(Asn)/Glu-tRNA(Gln) amidotransferase subunit GatB [Patescibacteria group bacterium]|nr:Asp-tRNA(Asn)/Glu-tRNA(Gln) amidotransferase subunit GatB [Patescibacteria group bacterium]